MTGAGRRPEGAPGGRPEAVLLDFSGTLFDPGRVLRPERLAARCAAAGRVLATGEAAALTAAVLAAVDSPEGRAARRDADLSPERHRRAWTALAAAVPGAGPVVAEAFHACVTDTAAWSPYPDAPGLLTALHRAGIPVAVVSNTGWDIRGSFRAAGLDGLVDAYVLSCELGAQKPGPEPFAAACERLGVAPGRALMVGDDPAADGGAVAAGVPVYLLPPAPAAGPRGLAPVLRLAGVGDPVQAPDGHAPDGGAPAGQAPDGRAPDGRVRVSGGPG